MRTWRHSAGHYRLSVSFGWYSGEPCMDLVTGFDYSSNWCGPIYDVDGTTVLGYQGHKVIIMIPIKMNPEAAGGPGVSTNAEGSGIYINADDEEALLEFESPKVSLPVNLHIKKQGLKEGESAKFTIMRKR